MHRQSKETLAEDVHASAEARASLIPLVDKAQQLP